MILLKKTFRKILLIIVKRFFLQGKVAMFNKLVNTKFDNLDTKNKIIGSFTDCILYLFVSLAMFLY